MKSLKMEKQLLFYCAIVVSQIMHGQLPTGSNGKTLYQKGECKTLIPNVSYKCTFCEDEELTKNCKEYDCSLTECKESKRSKGSNGRLLTKPISIEGKHIRMRIEKDTTNKLPQGTKLENGKIVVTSGYKAVQSSDKKIVFIISDNGPGIRGGFRCDCDGRGTGACNTSLINDKIVCGGDDCCEMVVTINDSVGLTMQAAEKAPEKLTWKKVVFSVKSN